MRREKVDGLQWGDPRCKGMTAGIYTRLSTASEGKSASCDQQLEICQNDAQRFGFGKVVIFAETEGSKGDWGWSDPRFSEPHRPELTKLVDAIKKGEIQAILVYKQDRIVRDSGVADALNKLFRQYGTRFISRGRDTEVDTARGLYQVAVDSANARQWRDQISEDIIRDHGYKFRRRMFTRNPACFGWRSCGIDSQAAKPEMAEIEIVRRIYRMYLGIGVPPLGPYQIANVLEKEGVKVITGSKGHPSKNKKRVFGSAIRQILENPMMAGFWVHNGEMAAYDRLLIPSEDGTGEPTSAIPEEWYYAAQAKLASTPATGRKASGDKRLLSGIVVCASCGRPMHMNSKSLKLGGRTNRWFCKYRVGAARDCWGETYATIVEGELDSWVLNELAPYLASELCAIDNEGDGNALRDELAKLKRKISELKEIETKKLRSALMALDEDQIAALALELRSERQDTERRIMEVQRSLGLQESSLGSYDDLSSKDPAVLKTAVRRLLNWIAVSDRGVTVLTSAGSYIGASFVEKDRTKYSSSENRRTILPPTVVSVAMSPSWIGDPVRFAAGRRDAIGKTAAKKTDDDLLPGVWADRKQEDDAENK